MCSTTRVSCPEVFHDILAVPIVLPRDIYNTRCSHCVTLRHLQYSLFPLCYLVTSTILAVPIVLPRDIYNTRCSHCVTSRHLQYSLFPLYYLATSTILAVPIVLPRDIYNSRAVLRKNSTDTCEQLRLNETRASKGQ
jgi:hypothetical protein